MAVTSATTLGNAFLKESIEAIQQEHKRIQHCFKQLPSEAIGQRPTPHVNSIGILVQHLCGNMRQWFIHGVGGATDVRMRAEEFIEDKTLSKKAVLKQLDDLLHNVYTILEELDSTLLLEKRSIQEWDVTMLSAIYSTVTHLEGHAQQITYITHMILGEQYEPFWKPEKVE